MGAASHRLPRGLEVLGQALNGNHASLFCYRKRPEFCPRQSNLINALKILVAIMEASEHFLGIGSGRSVARLARLVRVQEVVSSNLTAPTILHGPFSLLAFFPNT